MRLDLGIGVVGISRNRKVKKGWFLCPHMGVSAGQQYMGKSLSSMCSHTHNYDNPQKQQPTG